MQKTLVRPLGWGRSPGERIGYPFQCSCLENSHRQEPGGLQPMRSQIVLVALDLGCCTRAFFSCGEQGLFSSCGGCKGFSLQWLLLWRGTGSVAAGVQASLLCGMWYLPVPGIELMSPALAGEFLSTVPPGKSPHPDFFCCYFSSFFFFFIFWLCLLALGT